MFRVTARARNELYEMLGEGISEPPPRERDVGFRVVVSRDPSDGSALGLTLDDVREGDEVFDHEGRHVLLVGARAQGVLDGLVLDVVDTAQGRRLGLTRGR